MVDIRTIYHFMVIFVFKFFPLKTSEKVMYAWVGLVHFSTLSQRRVRLAVNRVKAERDSMLTDHCEVRLYVAESTRNAPIFTQILLFRVDSLALESHSLLTQLTWSLT
jgi:hypothetical protein